MPKRKVRGARARGTGPPPLHHCCRRLPAPGARVDAGRAGEPPARGSRRGRRPQAIPARRSCPRAPEAILEERRPRREEPCWRLFILLPSGPSRPPRAPSPTARPPPAPPGGRAIQTRKGGKAAFGVGGRGNALPPKNRRREGAGPARRGSSSDCPRSPRSGRAPPPPTSSPGRARLPHPPSTAAMATALSSASRGFVCTSCSCCSCLARWRGRLRFSARGPGPVRAPCAQRASLQRHGH